MAEADPFPTGGTGTATRATGTKRQRMRVLLMFAVPFMLVVAGLVYWFGNPTRVSTDNAVVKQDIVSVAGEVTGLIVSANVRENQLVKAGDVLFTIDPAPYRVAIAQADAQIASAQANMTALQADVGANAADIAGMRDDLVLAEANYAREKALMDKGFNTRAQMDVARHAVATARDRLASVGAAVAKARAQLANGEQVPGVNPEVAAGQATRAKAALDLSRTVVRAPAAGRISQSSRLQPGQMVFPGVPMVSIVVSASTRVDANFKESDIGRMRPGQQAEVRVDAYPGLVLKGHVESIGAGTGSEFSVLPAQNATGNWVKITQRVPVRIAIDSQSSRPLLAGLSTQVTVDVGQR